MKINNKLKFGMLIFLIFGVIFTVNKFNLVQYFRPTVLQSYVESFGILAPLVFIGIYAFAAITFLPGTPLTITSGVLFGTLMGTIYAVIGATIGAGMAFFIARFLGESFIEKLLKNKFHKLYEYDEKLEHNGMKIVLFLRFIPLFPFNGLNFALGLSRLRMRDFLIGTFFGIIPGSFALAFFGSSVTLLSPLNIVLSVGLLVLLFLSLPIYNKGKSFYEQRSKK